MKSEKIILLLSKAFILLSCFSLLSVSFMAFNNPQSVMDLVAVKLTNNDAISSIRGVYGGVGLTLVVALLYTLRKNISESLGLLSILWGLYAVSRLITIVKEGFLGAFGKQWLGIETVFFLTAVVLFFLVKRMSIAGRQPKISFLQENRAALAK
jgi:hypothetical protein